LDNTWTIKSGTDYRHVPDISLFPAEKLDSKNLHVVENTKFLLWDTDRNYLHTPQIIYIHFGHLLSQQLEIEKLCRPEACPQNLVI